MKRLKYIKLFDSYSINESSSGFLNYASQKSSSPNIYPSYSNIEDPSLNKFSCQVGNLIISYDDTTKREYENKQVPTTTIKVWMGESLTKEQVMDPENSGVEPDDIFEKMPGYNDDAFTVLPLRRNFKAEVSTYGSSKSTSPLFSLR